MTVFLKAKFKNNFMSGIIKKLRAILSFLPENRDFLSPVDQKDKHILNIKQKCARE